MNDEAMSWAFGLSNVEGNIKMLESVAETKKEKRAAQFLGAFLGVREYPKPDIKWRIKLFFWSIESCIKWPYWKISDWLKR